MRRMGFPFRINEERALRVLGACARGWANREGFYAHLVSPQQRYTPPDIREHPAELARWLFGVSIPMRGDINSDDAFRFMRGLHAHHPELFAPLILRDRVPSELIAIIRAATPSIQNGADSPKRAGTLSYKLEEHVASWIQNAKVLAAQWGGDIRNVFWGVSRLEQAFQRIEGRPSNPAGFAGMQRKIFSLLALWLQEFGLIARFPLPIVVDFHAMRVLLVQGVVVPKWKCFGPGAPRNSERLRPASLQQRLVVKATPRFVNGLIAWSDEFLRRHGLSSHDVSHGLWYLSRELCASYYGNRSFLGGAPETDKGRDIRLVDPAALAAPGGWPSSYRNPCELCTLEDTCEIAIPQRIYYRWGVLLTAGPHVRYPQPHLPGIAWHALPTSFRNGKRRVDENARVP